MPYPSFRVGRQVVAREQNTQFLLPPDHAYLSGSGCDRAVDARVSPSRAVSSGSGPLTQFLSWGGCYDSAGPTPPAIETRARPRDRTRDRDRKPRLRIVAEAVN